jgi:membrane dipeptidase
MDAFIGHTDTLLNFFISEEYDFLVENRDFQVDLPRLKKGGIRFITFAVFVKPEYRFQMALGRVIQIIDQFYQLLEECQELIPVKDINDLNRVIKEKKIGALLAIEGADCVFEPGIIRILYHLGVRILSLTWNHRNQLADGIGELAADGGVTLLGRQVINEMERLRMILDVSHLSPRSFQDVLKYSHRPFIATHSNAWNLCQHPRNLTDQQLKAIANRGGHIGINFAPSFLNKTEPASINDVINQIDYLKKLIGIEYITLGTDFDGISTTPEGLKDVSYLPVLENALHNRGYSEDDISGIYIDNWINFLKAFWGES